MFAHPLPPAHHEITKGRCTLPLPPETHREFAPQRATGGPTQEATPWRQLRCYLNYEGDGVGLEATLQAKGIPRSHQTGSQCLGGGSG